MKTIRVIYNHFSADQSTLNFKDVTCSNWEVTGGLLVLYKPKQNLFIPLVQVQSFYEIETENE